MHMARRAAAWVAWAEWTCSIRHCRRNLQVPVTVKESGLRPALCFCCPNELSAAANGAQPPKSGNARRRIPTPLQYSPHCVSYKTALVVSTLLSKGDVKKLWIRRRQKESDSIAGKKRNPFVQWRVR